MYVFSGEIPCSVAGNRLVKFPNVDFPMKADAGKTGAAGYVWVSVCAKITPCAEVPVLPVLDGDIRVVSGKAIGW